MTSTDEIIAAKDKEIASIRETLRIERGCRLNETRLKDHFRGRALEAEARLQRIEATAAVVAADAESDPAVLRAGRAE